MSHLKIKERPHKWRTSFNNKKFPPTDEVSFKPSETRPNEVMSIREIEARFANGRSLMDVLPRPVWDQLPDPEFEDYLPDLRLLDHADRMELLEQTQFELDEIKKKANDLAKDRKAKKEAEKAEQEKALAEKMAAILAAKTGSGGIPDPE